MAGGGGKPLRQRTGASVVRPVLARWLRPAARATRRRERDKILERLRAHPDRTVAAVGRALTAAVTDPTPGERAWLERIEGLRTDLGRSHEVVRNPRSVWTGDPGDEELRERTVSHLALHASKPARWGRVLLHLVRELRLERCVELGTCVGLSAAYQAAALDLAGASGTVVTLEADEPRIALARANLERLGLASRVEVREGRFHETLDDVLDALVTVDFAFVDGHHKKGPTLDYFERISARMGRPGVLLFDDIAGSRGMTRAWERISADGRLRAALDLGGLGLCVVGERDPRGDGQPLALRFFLHP